MRSFVRAAALLAAGSLIFAQHNGDANGKANGRGDRPIGALPPPGSTGTGAILLNYNGGPVMLGQTHIYYIYYGDWSVDTKAGGILNNFANNLSGSGYYNILTQYYSGSSPNLSYISNSVSLAGSTTSTYVASNPTNLTDSDILGIVQAAINNKSLPYDPAGLYFVLTAPGVGESSGFLSSYCGWHTAAFFNNNWIKYSFVGDAGNQSGCSVQFGNSPNGDPPVDAMISVISHELAEAVTDPVINAWYDANGQEIGDKCAWNFGTEFPAPNGSSANIILGGYYFLIQQEFSNASDSCVMTYAAAPDFNLSVAPSSQSAAPGASTGNYTVSVNDTNGFTGSVTLSVTAGLPAGATANAFTPNPTTGTATFNISLASGTAPGTYPLTITGTSGTLTHTAAATLVVLAPDFSVSVSPASQTVVQGGSTANPYVVTVTPVNGFTGTPTLSVTGNPSGSTVNITGLSFTINSVPTTAKVQTYTLTITATSGKLVHTTTASLVVNPVGSFTISVSASQTVKRKGSVKYTVTVTPSGGFNGPVSFSVTGLPNRVSSSFSPATVTASGTTTLTVGTAANTPTGSYTLRVTGTSGTLTASATTGLTVK